MPLGGIQNADDEAEKLKKDQANVIAKNIIVKVNIKKKSAGDEEGFLTASVTPLGLSRPGGRDRPLDVRWR